MSSLWKRWSYRALRVEWSSDGFWETGEAGTSWSTVHAAFISLLVSYSNLTNPEQAWLGWGVRMKLKSSNPDK